MPRSGEPIASWEQLLRASRCKNEADFAALLEDRSEWDVFFERDGDDGIVVGVGDRDATGLSFPFRLAEVWETVDQADVEYTAYQNVAWLPEHEPGDTADCTVDLAGFFDTDIETFTAHAGASWVTAEKPPGVDVESLQSQDRIEDEQRWFSSGEPVQVLLGVLHDIAVVATPYRKRYQSGTRTCSPASTRQKSCSARHGPWPLSGPPCAMPSQCVAKHCACATGADGYAPPKPCARDAATCAGERGRTPRRAAARIPANARAASPRLFRPDAAARKVLVFTLNHSRRRTNAP